MMSAQTSSTFTSCMHDQMLESNRDDVKLEAMRCITVMTAKGKLSVPRTLFPHIVKNVSSKNPELKKLIYLYLTNFADQQPDLALLPVATLQKSLKSPNPLVRSSALKVLTSMRLNILSGVLMATVRNSVNDLSPYVRKTVCHSIIKIYRLEPDLKDDLVEYIERTFKDKNSMVLSSAVAAFEVVCPERLDLLHKQYKRFAFLLADCNEWGQTLLLRLLIRYVIKYGQSREHDVDPKVLLRAAKPLVHSNNSAVVMAVVKLYIAIANQTEVRSTIPRPLLRLLYCHREIQLVVLNLIEDLTSLESRILKATDANKKEANNSSSNNSNADIKSVKSASSNVDQKDSSGANKNNHSQQEQQLDKFEIISNKSGHSESGRSVTQDNNDTETQANQHDQTGENPLENHKPEAQNHESEAEDGEEVEGNKDEEECEEEEEEEEEEDEEEEEEEEEEDEEDEEDDEEDEEMNEEKSEDEVDVNDGELIEDGDSDAKSKVDQNEYQEVTTEEESDDEKVDNDSGLLDSNLIDFNPITDPNAYKEIFRPYVKSFYVKHTDCTQIRLAKLKILTNLSSPVNVTQILRELQAYIATYVEDRLFVAASIHAIGQCSIIVNEVAPTCLNGLTSLLSNNNEHIVAEAIVVLRSQIINKSQQSQVKLSNSKVKSDQANDNNGDSIKNETDDDAKTKEQKSINEAKNDDIANNQGGADDGDHGTSQDDQDDEEVDSDLLDNEKIVSTVIKQVTRLLPKIIAPQARATILWILAEFCERNKTAAKCAPNVLRAIAKSFCQEDNFVKLQALTLASKFLLSLDKEEKGDLYNTIQLLTGYLFSLAKYDTNHDVRDRGRFLKKLLEDESLGTRVLLSNGVV